MSAQSMQALAVANDRRLRRAALKRQCRAGTVDVMSLIASGLFDKVLLLDLLQIQARWGQAIATRTMVRLALPLTTTVGGLGARQTALLSRYLRAETAMDRDEIAAQARSVWQAGRRVA